MRSRPHSSTTSLTSSGIGSSFEVSSPGPLSERSAWPPRSSDPPVAGSGSIAAATEAGRLLIDRTACDLVAFRRSCDRKNERNHELEQQRQRHHGHGKPAAFHSRACVRSHERPRGNDVIAPDQRRNERTHYPEARGDEADHDQHGKRGAVRSWRV